MHTIYIYNCIVINRETKTDPFGCECYKTNRLVTPMQSFCKCLHLTYYANSPSFYATSRVSDCGIFKGRLSRVEMQSEEQREGI